LDALDQVLKVGMPLLRQPAALGAPATGNE
jgi:hypothetical protein